eukprot:1182275-Prorocentrum_minimum.AAC.3
MKADRRLMSQEATVKEERALKGWLPPKKRWTMTWQPSGSTQFWTTALALVRCPRGAAGAGGVVRGCAGGHRGRPLCHHSRCTCIRPPRLAHALRRLAASRVQEPAGLKGGAKQVQRPGVAAGNPCDHVCMGAAAAAATPPVVCDPPFFHPEELLQCITLSS